MILDIENINGSTREQAQARIVEFLRQSPAMQLATERFPNFTFQTLRDNLQTFVQAAEKAEPSQRAGAHAALIIAAALIRDMNYATAGRKHLLALGYQQALYRHQKAIYAAIESGNEGT